MTRTLRRIGLGTLALIALWSAGWFYASGRMIAEIQSAMRGLEADGISFHADSITRSGFPFTLTAQIDKIQARGPNWQGNTAQVIARILPWKPQELVLFFPAVLRMTADQGPALSLTLSAGQLALRTHAAALEAELSAQAMQTAAGPTAETADTGPSSGPLRLRLTRTQPPPSDLHGQIGALTLDIADLVIPRAASLPGPTLTLGLSSTLSGPAVSGPSPRAIVTAWRTGGGTLDLPRLTAVSGPTRLSANGRFSLDAQDRVIGAASAEIVAFHAVLEKMTNSGKLSARDALTARMLLQGLSQPDNSVKLPVTLQDGWLSVGPLRVVPLPPLPLGD